MNVKDYMGDYRKLRISIKDILADMGISRTTFLRRMKERGLESNFHLYKKLDFGDEELNTSLKNKYHNIVRRCNNYDSYQYKNGAYNGMEYLPLDEWVDFCLDSKDELIPMWERYLKSDKDMRLAISVDRVDNNEGYYKDNLQFVTHGFNSFKRNMRPVKVTHKEEDKHFMSPKEAGRSYGIREQSLGDMLNGIYREVSKEFKIEDSDIQTVLKKNNIRNCEEYYEIKYLK